MRSINHFIPPPQYTLSQLSRRMAVLAVRAVTRDAVGQTWCGVRLALAIDMAVGRRTRGPGQGRLRSLHLALGMLVHGAGVRTKVEGRRRRHGDGVGRVLGSSRHFCLVVVVVGDDGGSGELFALALGS